MALFSNLFSVHSLGKQLILFPQESQISGNSLNLTVTVVVRHHLWVTVCWQPLTSQTETAILPCSKILAGPIFPELHVHNNNACTEKKIKIPLKKTKLRRVLIITVFQKRTEKVHFKRNSPLLTGTHKMTNYFTLF